MSPCRRPWRSRRAKRPPSCRRSRRSPRRRSGQRKRNRPVRRLSPARSQQNPHRLPRRAANRLKPASGKSAREELPPTARSRTAGCRRIRPPPNRRPPRPRRERARRPRDGAGQRPARRGSCRKRGAGHCGSRSAAAAQADPDRRGAVTNAIHRCRVRVRTAPRRRASGQAFLSATTASRSSSLHSIAPPASMRCGRYLSAASARSISCAWAASRVSTVTSSLAPLAGTSRNSRR